MQKTSSYISGFIKDKDFEKAVVENFWYRKETPAVFQVFYPFMIGFGVLPRHFKHFYKTNIVACSNGYGWYYATEEDGLKVGKMLYDTYTKDKKLLLGKRDEWQKDLTKLYMEADKIHKVNLSKLSASELVSLYQDFLSAFYFAWSIPLIYEMNMVYVEQVLAPYLQRNLALPHIEFNEVFAVLAAPLDFSYMTIERLELLKLALNYTSLKLVKHFEKYYWIKSTYRRMGLYSKNEIKSLIDGELKKGKKHIQKEIAELESMPRDLSKKQKALVNKYKIKLRDQRLFGAMAFLGEWQDKRKEMNIYGNHHLFLLIHEIARRQDMDVDLVACAFPSETTDVLLGKTKFDVSKLKDRFSYNLHAVDSHLREIFLTGERAKRIKGILDKKIEEKFKEVKGMVASIGQLTRITGEVRVVFDPYGAEIPQGAILVTPMTRPEFIHLIHKAGALITDEGGVTSHAAIISREFGIPCIVGTGNATKLLKDGDQVEVDMENGVVIKL